MRAEDGRNGGVGMWLTSEEGIPGTWKTNVAYGSAWKKRGAWGTPFSCFRFAIPELCNFEGRAVYLDADMLVRADMRELLEMPLTKGYKSISKPRTDVSVIDCSYFKDCSWWPSIEVMKKSGWITWHYTQLLMQMDAVDPTLDMAWNACDPMTMVPDPGVEHCKLLHFTVVPTQPYRPYPGVSYVDHPWSSWVNEWNAYHDEATQQAG